MPRQSVRNAVANREPEVLDVEKQIWAEVKWFKAVVPAHVNADQFIAVGLGLLRRDQKLAEAAVRNPGSFMRSLSDCARLGLVPGDGFALVPFENRTTGVPEVTGITEYTGEIDMMYRSGGVRAVVAEVIREHDEFRRGRPPFFEPRDQGLASDEERGALKGVFAYAVLDTGEISHVVVMGKDEVMRHKALAKTKRIWEGPFEASMWLKTAVHELFKWVPHSSEYLRELMRVQSVQAPQAVDWTPPAAAAIAPPPAAEPALPALAPDNPPTGEKDPVTEIRDMLVEAGIKGGAILATVSLLAGHPVAKSTDLTAEEQGAILLELSKWRHSAETNKMAWPDYVGGMVEGLEAAANGPQPGPDGDGAAGSEV